jgi:hypothetical protein
MGCGPGKRRKILPGRDVSVLRVDEPWYAVNDDIEEAAGDCPETRADER